MAYHIAHVVICSQTQKPDIWLTLGVAKMQNKYKILTFTAASLLLSSATFSGAVMAGDNTNTQPINVYGNGDGLTPVPTGNGDGLRPDPTAKYEGILAQGNGDGLFPDPASTEGPKPLVCLLGWCFSAN